MSPFPVWHDKRQYARFWKARVSLLLINKNRSKTSHGDLNNTKIEGVNGTTLRRRDRKRRNIKITDWLFDKTALEFDTLIPLRRRKNKGKPIKSLTFFFSNPTGCAGFYGRLFISFSTGPIFLGHPVHTPAKLQFLEGGKTPLSLCSFPVSLCWVLKLLVIRKTFDTLINHVIPRALWDPFLFR